MLTTSDEVLQLRQQITELQARVADLQAQNNQVGYLYRCELLINLQLTDFCKQQGIRVPRRFYRTEEISGTG